MTIEELLGYSTEDLVALCEKGDAAIEALIGEHFKYTRPEALAVPLSTEKVKVPVSNEGIKKVNSKATKQAKEAISKANMMVELANLMKQAGVQAAN